MKIIFMGTPAFAVPSLKILLENKFNVISTVTVPDQQKGRGLKTSFSDIKKFSLENNLPVLQPVNLKDESFIKQIFELQPDLIIVVAFRILPEEIFTIPKLGSFNLHASLLPKYRGAAPVNRAIINGESETGVTTFFLKEKVDTGNIILQKKIFITPEDDTGTLSDRLSFAGAETVLDTVKLIENGNFILSDQDNSQASSAPKIFRDDCKINWNSPSVKIHNLVRGLSPYPAAFTSLDNKIIKIYKTGMTDSKSLKEAGVLFSENKRLYATTADFNIEIKELQTEGKKRVMAIDFLNGLDRSREYIFQ